MDDLDDGEFIKEDVIVDGSDSSEYDFWRVKRYPNCELDTLGIYNLIGGTYIWLNFGHSFIFEQFE